MQDIVALSHIFHYRLNRLSFVFLVTTAGNAMLVNWIEENTDGAVRVSYEYFDDDYEEIWIEFFDVESASLLKMRWG